MPIGKYKGKTLPQLLLTDPNYFSWAMEQDDFFRSGLAKEAADILQAKCEAFFNDPANFS
ncbi:MULTISPECIES: exodeoxyribonuclease X C-terminal domain-containing protein [Rhizobium/Agrobacterium group]|uniref:Exodeoxyribonuclease X-like C-terminal domain-containing protein n=2 Tax=Agrobacterium tumefaciens TaxID=358 RepID=A0A2Z2PL30_AGRTU|nr:MULTISPECIES: hypothetical protein [Rhizobium/Agrobacterium group]AHK05179.1 hypothetical protein X971_5340 [Agrobacterium tumefaciens LBA4213 (Ach5)]AKC10909.1 hypothetical protein Ach5_51460 [Agrobacterium tumefaciens]ASK41529.1 hypothetical protein [Agrobacterium tumefaciens]ASK47174.1 hypothetical protein [Agrobacterium radiobacter]AVH45223.1 hypothetical protein At1D1609_51890 [Agrobacterium tumefaciens]